MNLKSIILQLKEDGWNINGDFLEDLKEDQSLNYQAVVRQLLNTDLKDSGLPCLPSDLLKGKGNDFSTPVVLQVSNVRNISAPKANEGSAAAPRMLRITLTDGSGYINGIEVQTIKSLSLKTAPGTKLKFVSRIQISGGHLLLTPSNTEVLGGVVEELFQKWKLSQSVSKYARTFVSADGSGPPAWVPFGQKIDADKERIRNFKALGGDSNAKEKEENEFENQRKQVVQELAKESSKKVFGGGKHMLDSNVQRVVNAGFTIEEAEWSLKRNKNDAHKAIFDLRYAGEGRVRSSSPEPSSRGSGRGGRRGRGRGGRDRGGPDGSDEDVPHSITSRPSGPASLLDYLEPRLEKTGQESTPTYVEEKPDYRNNRGRRGNDFTKGRRGYKEQTSYTPVEKKPTMSPENWPSLNKETEIPAPSGVASSNKNSTYEQEDYSYSQGRYGSNQQQNYQVKQDNYESNRGGHRDSRENYRNEQPRYKENSNYNARYNESSGYKNNQANFKEQPSYRTNKPTYQNSQPYQNNQSTYQNNQPTYQNNQPTFQNNQPAYKGNVQPKYSQEEREPYYEQERDPNSYYTQKKFEQPYPRQRVVTNRGSYGRNQDYDSRNHYNSQYNENYNQDIQQSTSSFSRGNERPHSSKEKDLISQFEKSMVMAGYYDGTKHDAQASNSHSHAEKEEYAGPVPYYSQDFSGSYEYYRGRGGGGYVKRGRSRPDGGYRPPRRGRY